MNLLCDTSIGGFAVRALKDAGHDVLWVADMRGDMTDLEVLETAKKRKSVFVTADADYGDAFLEDNMPHPTVVRLVGMTPSMQSAALLELIENQSENLAPSSVLTGGLGVE